MSANSKRTFIPDGRSETEALAGATMLGICAHADDLELMAWHGIFNGFGHKQFAAVVVTDGAGSPRAGRYATLSDQEMVELRWDEQKKAAQVGGYAAVIGLGLSSAEVKARLHGRVSAALADVIDAVRPEVVYTHNLLDAHDTHVAVAVHVITALRALPPTAKPRAVYACEVWRSLDWLPAADRVALDVSGRDHLAAALMGVHDSQIAGGKRYDLAALGRKRANATFSESHAVDRASAVELAMDLTPLVKDASLNVHDFALAAVQRFADEASARLKQWKS